MRLGYNTNGFAHHRIEDTFAILEDLGYQSVAVTLDHPILTSPDRKGISTARQVLSTLGARHGLRMTLETGARFLLDPWRKHYPTLIAADADDRAQRLEFLMACVDLASDIGADSVSFWSGSNHDGLPESEAWAHLVTGLHQLVEYANQRCVKLAFEPEPGMLVQYMDEFLQLADRLSSMGNHECFGLTLDVGHVHCLSDGKNDDHIRTHQDRLFNIHIEDMIPGTHEHLMFGEGNLDFDRVFTALHEIKYQGPVHVELSRHSHDAVETARAAFEFLQSLTKP